MGLITHVPTAQERERRWQEGVDVVLVSMPFGLIVTPSLALGLLQASLKELPYRSRQWYPCLKFAEDIDFNVYWKGGNRWEIGDWAFAEQLFPDHDLDAEGFVENILRRPSADQRVMLASVPDRQSWIEDTVQAALAARSKAEEFLDDCMDELAVMKPRVVAFSCLFQQLVPSLALAKRLKKAAPETVIIFGGNECYGIKAIEVARQFSFVDAVVSGAGDIVFPQIVERAMQGMDLADLQGVYSPNQGDWPADNESVINAKSPDSMDDLPYPEFDGFFDDFAKLSAELPVSTYLSLETSRGCWWAENPKRHCTFCSLNGATSKYFSKSPERMTDEIEYFVRRHPEMPLIMTDSIVEMDYFQSAFSKLADRDLGATIQYEMRANMTKPQMRILRDAGVTLVQPGIESLSTPVLKLMRKYTTTLSNVQFLKWAEEIGLTTMWNLLGGFPGESVESYDEMAALIPLITHLPPPDRFRLVELNRWAPMFEQSEEFGITNLRPVSYYAYVYPFASQAVTNLAAYFDYDYIEPQPVEEYSVDVQREVRTWKDAYENEISSLVAFDSGEETTIVDRRTGFDSKTYRLQGLTRFIHAACDQVRSIVQLKRLVDAEGYIDVSTGDIQEILAALKERRLIIREGDRYLALAIHKSGFNTEQFEFANQPKLVRNGGQQESIVPAIDF